LGIYAYQVINKAGEMVNGQIEADQEEAAVEKLQKMGFMLLEISQKRSLSFQGLLKPAAKKVSLGDLTNFSRQLAAMLDAGIPLTRSLFALSKQATNRSLGEAVNDAARNVESGASFSNALREHPKVFSPLYINMVNSGEVGGALQMVLQRLANQLEQEKNLRDQVRAASLYPTIILGFAMVIIVLMLILVVPIFIQFFPAGMVLPLPTRMMIAASESLRQQWYVWILFLFGIINGVRFYFRSPSGIRHWDRLKLRLPVVGSLFQRILVARFSRTFSTLLAGGIPVMQALEAAGPAVGNTMITDTIKVASEKIQEGKSIAQPLEESGIFPPMVIQMIAVGEETGALPFLLERVAEFYENEVSTMTKGLISLIEPILLIAIGCTVGMMVVFMYLPIFTAISSGVGN
jgi:type IV pilus assembly protein PilC